MEDEKKTDADGFIREINKNTDFYARKSGSAVIICEIGKNSPIDLGSNYGYQFDRMEKSGEAIFFPLS